MSLQLHRPDRKGELEPRRVADNNWRNQLTSPRWGRSLRGGRMPELRNAEMNPTSVFMSVLFWLGLGIATFVVLVLGYGVGFWQLGG